ncbi:MAG: 50S ribosomal protein L1 [Chlamydiae bacterium CG10_big_fil_rev_8_21_14_0_10_42_34]|nr:MAG: 50S ribosomal protein L1 [Chlamydiae bacterium CG10_big_fil_rev_8_21_14_0_10_42_34]
MAKRSKRMKEVDKSVDKNKTYKLDEAIDILKKCPAPKFDQSVNVALKVGIDPKKSDQQVRGTVSLPHGTGQNVVLVVIAKGDKAKEALDAGADYAGSDELVEKIKGGWTDFSALIATPDMMRELGKLGKILGPRGLMPTPKAGTVTTDVAKAVKEVKAGKIEFKADKTGNVNNGVGKISFESDNLVENLNAWLNAVARAKPSSAKGVFMRSLYVSTTMGPGLKIDLQSLTVA